MRILTVGNRYPPAAAGGYERLWVAAVTGLRARGHAVRVLTTVPQPGEGTGAAGATLSPGAAGGDPDLHRELRWYWRDHAFPACSPAATVRIERANAAVLTRHVADFGPDVVGWFSMGGMSLSLLGQARAAGLSAVAIVADDWLSYGPRVDGLTRRLPAAARGRVAPLLTRMLGLGSGPGLAAGPGLRVSFISRFLRDAARASGGWSGPASVDHPGIDPDRFAAADARPWSGRLLYCGRLDPRKGVAAAIEALVALPDTTLTVDGDGDPAERDRLRRLSSRLGVASRVRWQCSPPAALPAVYAACDALVFPITWPEPWGLVPLEAMAVGRPVIASDAGGGAGEYLKPDRNCLAIAPGAPGELAAAVRRLRSDPELRERLVLAGRQTAGKLTQAGWLDAAGAHFAAAAA